MTLEEFSELWPYTITRHEGGAMVTPDAVSDVRALAWELTDYRVSSVAGGSIWFTRRDDATEAV